MKLKNEQDLEIWLVGQPRSNIISISARAALRLIPVFSTRFDLDAASNAKYFLSMFRSIASSYSWIAGPDKNVESASRVAAISARIEFEKLVGVYEKNETNLSYASTIPIALAAFSAHSVHSKSLDIHKTQVYRMISVGDDALLKGKIKTIWSEIEADVNYLNSGLDSNELIKSPLSHNVTESRKQHQNWKSSSNYLLKNSDEHWYVWIDWWEDRRDGKPYNIEMEREIVLIPDEDWEKGPAHVNAMIAEIRAKYAAQDIPADNPVAPRFETVENRVVLRAETPDALPDDEQESLYDALREQVVELCGLCPENSNRYGAQGKAVARFLAGLGDDYGSMDLSALWLAGQKMRRFARADEAKRAAADPEDDPMEPDQSALFAEVVMTYNVFSTGEPGLKAKDDKGSDPATLSPDVTEEARAVRGAVAGSPALFDEDVIYVLDQVLEEAEDPIEGVEARGKVMVRETNENLIGALARKARTELKPEASEFLKGYKGAAGAATFGAKAVAGVTFASAFIAVNEAVLIAYAAKLPLASTWIAIIKSIAAKWDKVI